MYSKDDFEAMIGNWQTDGAPEYDDLEIDEPKLIGGRLVAVAHDSKDAYELSDDGTGNIVINYIGAH